jgi:protein DGCR14
MVVSAEVADRLQGDAMPSINNYPLLPNDPSPSPQDLPSLLTWGTLISTPRALDGGDDPLDTAGPSFRLPEAKRRDELGRKLADKASRSMNERAKGFTPRGGGSALSAALRSAADKTQKSGRGATTPGMMLPPSATPRRQADSLTPAGKRLLERSLGRSPMTNSGKLGISTGGRNRGAAMEKGSGWGNLGKSKNRELGSMSWTPSPAQHRN